MAVEQLVHLNKSPEMILKYIERDYAKKWSKRTLRRFCAKYNIKRYDCNLLPRDVMDAIMEESKGCAEKLGYRMMWQRLRRKGILVKRDQVAVCMQILGVQNPAPIQKRKHKHCYVSKGPNSVWHIDGNDKLMRWGFYTHGAIDGYSRKILWLNVFVTNKDPWLIGKFFMDTVESRGICPRRVQCDPGTENPVIAKCQMFLRRNDSDSLAGAKSYFEGSSVLNQPIESFWRHFREGGMQFWIDHFKKLESDGEWNPGNGLHK